ncbi:acyl-CoA thioesterase [Clostridium sp. BJN0013]|uniref:acyl-CoA thioesterase n=1 Tax=Clostridium sp. BJN0013 TaxID=3236840 RepID=UPI0034C64E9C
MSIRAMLVEREIEIKAYDIDVIGIVSNIVYVRWFEDLRHSFLDKYYPYEEMIQSKKSPILVKTEIEYKAPLTIYDKPLGKCWVTSMGRSRWEMGFEIYSGETINCLGKQLGCFFDLEKKKLTRVPQNIVLQYNREVIG